MPQDAGVRQFRSAPQSPSRQRGEAPIEVFASVERGLNSGSVTEFSRHFASQVSVNLRGGEHGLFSSNQVTILLETYFRTRKLTGARFSTTGESGAMPFATGSAAFAHRGVREYVQIYVALSSTGDRWAITQLNIY